MFVLGGMLALLIAFIRYGVEERAATYGRFKV
jgi:hypothetical protein